MSNNDNSDSKDPSSPNSNERLYDKDLAKLVHRIRNGLKDDAPVDGRGKHHMVKRLETRVIILQIYRESSGQFHYSRGGKFHAESLVQEVIDRRDKNPSLFEELPSSERTIRSLVSELVRMKKIPLYIWLKDILPKD